MAITRLATEQPRAFGLGLGVGVLLIASGFLLAVLLTGEVRATHDGSGVLHVCVQETSGNARFDADGECGRNETLVDLAGPGELGGLIMQVRSLETDVATQETAIADIADELGDLTTAVDEVPACLTEADDGDALFTGCDVEIRNGMGSTDTINGKGNLIVGYNEISPQDFYNEGLQIHTGSHNIVGGKFHNYTSYGGLVVGLGNHIIGAYSSVSGGGGNEAIGDYSSISGGSGNEASGPDSSVSGGIYNVASGENSSVSGGSTNEASGDYSSVSGGFADTVGGIYDWRAGNLYFTTD